MAIKELEKVNQKQGNPAANENGECKHFITKRISRSHVEKIYVDDEQYNGWNRFVSLHRKKAQRCGECLCPRIKLWQCDADCEKCPYFNNDKYESLDVPQFENDKDSEMKIDYVADERTEKIEEHVVLQFTLENLIAELNEKEPKLGFILSTLYNEVKANTFENLSLTCQKIGMSSSSFYHTVGRLKKILNEYGLKDF